jgi:hypothetical protein
MRKPVQTAVCAFGIMLTAAFSAAAEDEGFFDPFAADALWEEQPAEADSQAASDPPAADFDPFSDFDALFYEDTGITEAEIGDTDAASAFESLLVSERLSWGGRYSGSLSYAWDWDSYLQGITAEDARASLNPSASSSLYFDSRPEVGYRVFGKLSIETQSQSLFGLEGIDLSAIDFTTNSDGSFTFFAGEEEEDQEDTDAAPLSLTLSVQELFADFQYRDTLFFRFGKSFITWGVGYFFSPADVVNLEAIDAEDPSAERQGPLHFRMQYPSGRNNLYLYLVADQAEKPQDTTYALKYELVSGGSEISFAGVYSYTGVPRLVSTLSTSLGEVRLFAEGLVSFGSSRVFTAVSAVQPEFAEDTEPADRYTALDTFTIDNLPLASATAGFTYNRTDPDLFLVGQYYFNGEGYPLNTVVGEGRTLLDSAYYLLLNPGANGLAKDEEEQTEDYRDPPALNFSDVTNFARHYGAAALSWNSIAGTDLSASIFWIGNLTDSSGIISPTLSWSVIERVSASFGLRMTYGRSGTEFADPAGLFAQDPENDPQEPTLSLTVQFSIGGGSF